MTKTLFEINQGDKVTYGHKLAVNSSGFWVMEEKGTGNVLTADKKDVTEVVPYTVDIEFMGGRQHYSYLSKEGRFNVGDILVMPSNGSLSINPAIVVGVGTKSRSATKELEPISRLAVDNTWKDV